MAQVERRGLLRGAAAMVGGAVLGGPFIGFPARAQAGIPRDGASPTLGPVADLRDGATRLWLPAGFQYRSFHDTEYTTTLADGTACPGRHDGMAAFPGPDCSTILVRNHEVPGFGTPFGDVGQAYDGQALGGCTTIQVSDDGTVLDSYTSLNGTMANCSGGATPWGTWISCEETVNGPDVGPDFSGFPNLTLAQRHGFIFEVPVGGQSDRVPITSAGRFSHEAVAYDPRGGYLYLTEDNFGWPSGLYRYRPPVDPVAAGRLADGGRLQMLAVKDLPNAHLEAHQEPFAVYKAKWVDIEDPAPSFPYTPGQVAPTTNDQALTYVAAQGWAQGAAYFSRLEGAVHDRGMIYFTATQGGGAAEPELTAPAAGGYGNGSGQVWGYHAQSETLRLVYQSAGPQTLDFPDNVTVSNNGTLIVCEDRANDNYLRGLTPNGKLFDIALNRLVGRNGNTRYNDEFAGSTFSPDGRTLFVNIQAAAGMTIAIWGDWESIGV